MTRQSTAARMAQFERERCLRRDILASSREDRSIVVDRVYKKLFCECPHHPRLTESGAFRVQRGRMKARLILPLLERRSDILEIGCGTGSVLTALSEMGHNCTGLEASHAMLDICRAEGLKVISGTADCIGCADSSFDLVFSQEVLEHLHPEDVPIHFCEAFRALRPNGILAIETPNRRTGPRDISRGFTKVAQGLHLKEWGVKELVHLFQVSGFVKIRGLLVPQFLARRSWKVHRITRVPAGVKSAQDLVLGAIPTRHCKGIAAKLLGLDDIFLFAQKPCAAIR